MILIILGGVFLLNNFGLLSWSVWDVLWRFWPLIIIFWGLEILFGDSRAANFIVGILTLIVVSYIVIQVAAINNQSFRSWLQNHLKWDPINEKLFFTPTMPNKFFNNNSDDNLL